MNKITVLKAFIHRFFIWRKNLVGETLHFFFKDGFSLFFWQLVLLFKAKLLLKVVLKLKNISIQKLHRIEWQKRLKQLRNGFNCKDNRKETQIKIERRHQLFQLQKIKVSIFLKDQKHKHSSVGELTIYYLQNSERIDFLYFIYRESPQEVKNHIITKNVSKFKSITSFWGFETSWKVWEHNVFTTSYKIYQKKFSFP